MFNNYLYNAFIAEKSVKRVAVKPVHSVVGNYGDAFALNERQNAGAKEHQAFFYRYFILFRSAHGKFIHRFLSLALSLFFFRCLH